MNLSMDTWLTKVDVLRDIIVKALDQPSFLQLLQISLTQVAKSSVPQCFIELVTSRIDLLVHNKLQKILLDITVCTFYVNNSILNYSEEIHLHITGECLFIGITIQLCPSTRGYYYWTPGDCTCMHAVKQGRRLENKTNL